MVMGGQFAVDGELGVQTGAAVAASSTAVSCVVPLPAKYTLMRESVSVVKPVLDTATFMRALLRES